MRTVSNVVTNFLKGLCTVKKDLALEGVVVCLSLL